MKPSNETEPIKICYKVLLASVHCIMAGRSVDCIQEHLSQKPEALGLIHSTKPRLPSRENSKDDEIRSVDYQQEQIVSKISLVRSLSIG